MSKLADLQEELSWTRSEKELVQAQLDSVRVLMAEKKSQLAITEETDLLAGSVTPQVEQLQSKIADWQLELATLQETFTDKHYKVAELKRRIAEAQERLQSEIAELVAEKSVNPISEWQSLVNRAVQLHVQLKGYEHKEKLAATKIDTFKSEHPDLLDKEVQLVRLEREARIREKTYMLLTDRYEEMLLLRQVSAQEFSVVDNAIPPKYPVGPRKMRITILGTLLGLILGVAVALFFEYMDDSIRRREDVEQYLGLSIVGSIPKIQTAKVPLSFPEATIDPAQDSSNADSRKVRNLKRKYRRRLEALQGRLVTNIGSKSPTAEGYRSLWTNIQFAGVDEPVKTILVTSPGPREGKSLTVANLALTIAQTGVRVLVVDTDLRRPTVHRLFGYRRSPGLSELISSDLSDIEGFVRNTYADNLYIITCGNLPSNPVGVLGSEKMKQLIEKVKDRFDIVLLDSPPLMAMADSSVLATESDATLLVLQVGQTKRRIANQAKELLQKLNTSVSGVVLNNIDYSKRYGYYGYHYYYRHYHDYYTQEEKDQAPLL
jgi:capsular exopolysaccharide synthesis family protein